MKLESPFRPPSALAGAPKSLLPISPAAILGILVVCSVMAYFLAPSDRVLLERQLRDGSNKRALATLQRISTEERLKDPEYYALLELRLTRQGLDPKSVQAVDQEILNAWQVCEKHGFHNDFVQELPPLLAMVSVQHGFDLIKTNLARMPLEAQQTVVDSLVNQSLAAGDPATAAAVYSVIWEGAPKSAATAAEMVRLWRFAQKPQQALAVLDAFAKEAGQNLARHSPALARARIDLLRELGRPGNALDDVIELVEASDPAQRDQLVDLMLSTARQSGRLKGVMPELRRRAEANPNDAHWWRTIGELASSAGDLPEAIVCYTKLVALAPNDGKTLLKLAQFYEWTGKPASAFDLYLRALPLKEPSAVERLLDLNPGLYRDAELAGALSKADDLVHQVHRGLEVARLQARAGNFQEAQRDYAQLVNAKLPDFKVLTEYGVLLIDLFDYHKALQVFLRADTLQPKQPVIQRTLADIYFHLGDYGRSFERYAFLAKELQDNDGIDNYITLAESLGHIDDVIGGLKLRITAAKKVAPWDYQRLVYFLNLQGKNDEARATLVRAVALFPQDPALRLQLSYALSNAKQHAEAARVLALHPELKNNPDLIEFYLTVLMEAEDYRQAELFLASGVNPKAFNDRNILDMQAQIYEANNKPAAAAAAYEKLYRQNPTNLEYVMNYARVLNTLGKVKKADELIRPFLDGGKGTPEMMKLAAEVFAAGGNYRSAETYLRRYLESRPRENSKAWSLMGDVLLSHGDKNKARLAYQRALDESLRQIASRPRR
jgi:tetratricopeptide (TPR) repeat protein